MDDDSISSGIEGEGDVDMGADPSRDDSEEGVDDDYTVEDEDEDDEFSIRSIPSTVTAPVLDQLRREYTIDPSIGLRVPRPGDDPCSPPDGEAVFHTAFFKAGLRLPLLPVFREILHAWGLAPGQLTPNTWRTIVCCYILWMKVCDSPLTAPEFLYMFRLKKDSGKKGTGGVGHTGWYYASSWDGSNIILRDRKTHMSKYWIRKWFFVKNWEFPPSTSPPSLRVPSGYRTLVTQHRPLLSDHLRERIKQLREYPPELREYSLLLSRESLARFFHRDILFGCPSAATDMPPKGLDEGLRRRVMDARKKRPAGESSSASGSKKGKTSSSSLPPLSPSSFRPGASLVGGDNEDPLSRPSGPLVSYPRASSPPLTPAASPASYPSLLSPERHTPEITSEMTRVAGTLQAALSPEEMREVFERGRMATLVSSIARSAITISTLVPLWNNTLELASQVDGLRRQIGERDAQLRRTEAVLQSSLEEHTRMRESFTQELTDMRSEVASSRREVDGMSHRIRELEQELIDSRERSEAATQELATMRSSFKESVAVKATEQIVFIMDELERRFPDADHSWICGGIITL